MITKISGDIVELCVLILVSLVRFEVRLDSKDCSSEGDRVERCDVSNATDNRKRKP